MFVRIRFLALAILALVASQAWAADSPPKEEAAAPAMPKLDWSFWRHLPVLADGRLQPLDTYAGANVDIICGRQNPTLEFDKDHPRRFAPSELLFSWMVQPERWENVPFLLAEHDELRDLLGVPRLATEGKHQGEHLKYVSPADIEKAKDFQAKLRDIAMKSKDAEKKRQTVELTTLEKKVNQLWRAYQTYRLITFDPRGDDAIRSRFVEKINAAAQNYQRVDQTISQSPDAAFEKLLRPSLTAMEAPLGGLLKQSENTYQFSLDEIEPLAAKIDAQSEEIAKLVAKYNDSLASRPDKSPDGLDTQSVKAYGIRGMVAARDLKQQAHELYLSLYDNGESLRLLPALNAASLESDRDTADDSQPWLNLQTLLYGSDKAVEGYPHQLLTKARESFQTAAKAYTDPATKDREQTFATATFDFSSTVRELGVDIEPLRQDLPIRSKDNELMAYTAYPAPGATDLEVSYNDLNPFVWGGMIGGLALVCFIMYWVLQGPAKSVVFWIGTCTLIIGLLWTAFAFSMRVRITHFAPVTNLYETVLFVPFVVSVLGCWFMTFPLIWTGVTHAWRFTAIPYSWEASPLTPERRQMLSDSVWDAAGIVFVVLRLCLMAGLFYFLTIMPYADGGRSILQLTPAHDVGATLPSAQNLLHWVLGLGVLAGVVWLVPRVVLTLLSAVVLVPLSWRNRLDVILAQIYPRWPFGFVIALVTVIGALVATFVPLPGHEHGPQIEALRPVLRSNFWLSVHVLSIVSSYGAGALAWGLGLVTLGCYLGGNYRDVARPELVAEGYGPAAPADDAPALNSRRPPEYCAVLAGYVYKAMQVAVLLLTVGTVTGGIWASDSWGRFWGWDPKEVWALISLLTYLIILHGRYAGWLGNFGLAMGSVFGATAIVMSWYGVNFLLGVGLHSYGFGDGGQLEMGLFVAGNWLLVIAAAVRYAAETQSRPLPPHAPTFTGNPSSGNPPRGGRPAQARS